MKIILFISALLFLLAQEEPSINNQPLIDPPSNIKTDDH